MGGQALVVCSLSICCLLALRIRHTIKGFEAMWDPKLFLKAPFSVRDGIAKKQEGQEQKDFLKSSLVPDLVYNLDTVWWDSHPCTNFSVSARHSSRH